MKMVHSEKPTAAAADLEENGDAKLTRGAKGRSGRIVRTKNEKGRRNATPPSGTKGGPKSGPKRRRKTENLKKVDEESVATSDIVNSQLADLTLAAIKLA